ncbi:hypothetical protein QVD99_006909 [Batrachochytrium dendrobatidis]|nr:hypothetical protein O5D80_007857 [Batrachochytrium dendrobatidis]KAK5666132.1 hypothetical protein QVD99_006909 [Batrachochytrium dendrobatidis]
MLTIAGFRIAVMGWMLMHCCVPIVAGDGLSSKPLVSEFGPKPKEYGVNGMRVQPADKLNSDKPQAGIYGQCICGPSSDNSITSLDSNLSFQNSPHANPSSSIFSLKKHTEPVTPLQYGLTLVAIGTLVIVGGIVAGLTIGLMSLDETNLSILKISGTQQEKAYAARIEPIRKNSHLLLVTLLLTNTIVNETLPIMFDSIHLQGWQAVLSSTVLIVIFGEIIPQAVCARYGLLIGAFFAWPVRILINVAWIVAYPISRLLDLVLGHKNGVVYRHAELKELVAMHGEDQSGPLTRDEVSVLRAVLELRDKSVKDVMTLLGDVFMLPLSAKLNLKTMQTIIQAGHSRVPVYDTENQHTVIGVVLVKQLIVFDPDEEIPVRSIKIRSLPRVLAETPLFDMLHIFESGGSHMALVVEEVCTGDDSCVDKCVDDSCTDETKPLLDHMSEEVGSGSTHTTPVSKPKEFRALGIVTLEDVIEELLGEEIIDETDVYVDIASKVRVSNTARNQTFFRHLLVSPRIHSAELPPTCTNTTEHEPEIERLSFLPSPAMIRQWSSPRTRGHNGSERIRTLVSRLDSSQLTVSSTSEKGTTVPPMPNLILTAATPLDTSSGFDSAPLSTSTHKPHHHHNSNPQPPRNASVPGVLDTSSLSPVPITQKQVAMAAGISSGKIKRRKDKDLVPAQDLATMLAANPMQVYTPAPRRHSAFNSVCNSLIQMGDDHVVDEAPYDQGHDGSTESHLVTIHSDLSLNTGALNEDSRTSKQMYLPMQLSISPESIQDGLPKRISTENILFLNQSPYTALSDFCLNATASESVVDSKTTESKK